jgi:hypothetical protein
LADFLADWKGKITTDQTSNLSFIYNIELPYLRIKAAGVRTDLGEVQRAKFNELIVSLSKREVQGIETI